MDIYVYILKCVDGSYYVGNTRRPLEARLGEHNDGVYKGYTYTRRPVELVYYEWTDNLIGAFQRERQLKGWNRAKKEALISANIERLPALSRRMSVQRKERQSPPPHTESSSS